ncbi:MAG: SagB/ThcOx family dehydrogenase [Prevotella sp.]|nr:SagB/ThcOx family dehydrogenase [Prevotella sp.]
MTKKSLITLAFAALMSGSVMAQDKMELPSPQFDEKSASVTLVEALSKRQSERTYASTDLSKQELSNLLWAACGINRPESKRITAPSAINAQDILVYVCRADGAWLYNAEQNTLTRVSTLDLRKAVAGRQEFAASAPVSLVLVSDISRVHNNRELGAMDAGYVSENIYLACTAMGLKTVARATMERDALVRELGLSDSQVPMLNHPVGK